MSFSRTMYDDCSQKQRLDRERKTQGYVLYDGKYNNSAKCRMEQGVIGGRPDSLYTGNLVDLESDLRGQTRKIANCTSKQYAPYCPLCACNQGLPCSCPNCPNQVSLRNIQACHPGIVSYNGGIFKR